MIGEGFGRERQRTFEADIAASVPVDPGAWARRGPLERLKERLRERLRERIARAFEHCL